MSLSDADRRFVERRRERTHIGLVVMPVLLAGLAALWLGLFIYWPLSINPMFAWKRYDDALNPPGAVTAATYAVIVTVLVNALFVAVGSALTFAALWARSERRYLRLLTRLAQPPKTEAIVTTTAETPTKSTT